MRRRRAARGAQAAPAHGSSAHSGGEADGREQRFDCGFGGSGFAFKDAAGVGAHVVGSDGVGQQVLQCFPELRKLDHSNCIRSEQRADDAAEVFVMRPHDDGHAELCGLEGIVAAGNEETSSNEGDMGERIDGGEFADGVKKNDGARRDWSRRFHPLGAQNEWKLALREQLFDSAEALRMARREDGDHVRRQRIEQSFFFAGEEEALLDALPPDVITILAPRHPERFSAVEKLLAQRQLPFILRSQWMKSPAPIPAGTVVLLDSIGELASIYSLAHVAFIGGGLFIPGGHNPLEPAQFGVPIVMGPHYENFRGIVGTLLTANAIAVVELPQLRETLQHLLTDTVAAHNMGAHARRVFESEAGATETAVEALLATIGLTTGVRA